MTTFEEICSTFFDDPNSIFYVLNDREKQVFRTRMALKTYRKGDYIFQAGDTPIGLTCLVDGKVKLFQEGVGGREQIVRMAKPIGFIGYRALFAEEIHAAHAMAIDESTVFSLDRETLFSILHANSKLCLLIIKSLATDLGFSYSRTVTLTQKHIPGRLAESLLMLKDTYGYENDEITLKACMSREDIAKLSNMSTSNAIRTLSNFANEKIIGIDGKRIKLLNVARLEQISGQYDPQHINTRTD